MNLSDNTKRNRSSGISYQRLLDTDTHPVPACLRTENPLELPTSEIPVERYIARDFFDLEVERLWKRVWQMACREEDIPEVGDNIIYDIAGMSFLVVRTAPDRIKALLQRLPAPRPHVARGGQHPRERVPLPVPRLRLEPRRHAEARAVSVGLPAASSPRSGVCPRRRSAPGAGSCSSTWIPKCEPLDDFPRPS